MNTGVFEYVCAYVSELQYYKLFLEEKSTFFFFFSLHEFCFVWCSCDVDPGLKLGTRRVQVTCSRETEVLQRRIIELKGISHKIWQNKFKKRNMQVVKWHRFCSKSYPRCGM